MIRVGFMSESKINAEIIANFQAKFESLSFKLGKERYVIGKEVFVRPFISKYELPKIWAEIRKLIEELNKVPSQEKEYIAINILQPLLLKVNRTDLDATKGFLEAVFGDMDLDIMKKVLFTRGPFFENSEFHYHVLFRLYLIRFRAQGPFFELLTRRYPDWINVRRKVDDFGNESFIYDKMPEDPLEPRELPLIFIALSLMYEYVDSGLEIAKVLLRQNVNVLVKASKFGPEKCLDNSIFAPKIIMDNSKALTSLEYFDAITSTLKERMSGKIYRKTFKEYTQEEIDKEISEIRALIVSVQEKAQRAQETRETLRAVPAGPEQTSSIPERISNIISQYADNIQVPVQQQEIERLERQRMDEAHEAHRREEEVRAKASSEREAVKKPNPGPPGGLETSGGLEYISEPKNEPKEEPKTQGPKGH